MTPDGSREPASRLTLYRRVTVATLTVLAAGCLAGIAVPAGLGWDFANFYDAGRRVVAGQIPDLYNPDSLIAGRPPQGTTGFFGAPISALLYVPMSLLPPEVALVVFKIQNVLAFAVAFAVLFVFCRAFVSGGPVARARFAALFVFLCLIYQPFWTIFRVGGQTTPTVLMLLTLGLVAHTAARFWVSAACVVLAVLIKPALATGAILLTLVAGVPFFWRLAVVSAGAGVVSLAVMGWPVHASFLDLMRRASQITYAWYFNSSIYITIDNLRLSAGPALANGPLQPAFAAATAALKAFVVVTILVLLIRSRRQRWTDAATRHFRFTLAIVFFLLWSPTIWEHYLSLLFLPLIYIVAASAHFRRSALWMVGLIFLLAIGQNLILINWVRDRVTFDAWPELLGVALIKSGPLLLTLVLLWRHAGELFRSYSAPEWTRP